MEKLNRKLQDDKQIILSIIKYFLIAAIVIGLFFLGFKILWLLLPVMIGFMIAHTSVVISSAIYKLVRRKRPRTLAEGGDSKGYLAFKLFVYAFILLTFIGFIILVIFALIAQVRNLVSFLQTDSFSLDFINNISVYLADLSKQLGGVLPQTVITRISTELVKLQGDLINLIPKMTANFLTSMLSFVGNFPDILFKIIVVIIAGYYFISDRIVIGKFIHTLFPSQSFVEKVVGAVSKVSTSFFRVLIGYMIIMTVTFVEALIGLSIIQMPYAVIIAIVVMFVDLLPMVGASACFVPIAIYMFAQGQPIYGVVSIAMVGIMAFTRSIIEPKVVGTAMKLHPLATLVAMLLGVAAFGIIGFLAGPILVVFFMGLSDGFGFEEVFRKWSGKILNKVAQVEQINELTGVLEGKSVTTRIRHVVMWRLHDTAHGLPKEEAMEVMKQKLQSLPSKIPQILSFSVGSDVRYDTSAYDLMLIAEFASIEDMNIYKTHPEHVEVANWIHEAVYNRSVVDMEI